MAATEPKMEFEDTREAREYLREWQHRLYLDDWIIECNLVDPSELSECYGDFDAVWTHRSAIIRIGRLNDDIRGRIVRVPNELVLVHELLHLKYPSFVSGEYENRYMDSAEHANLEQMARSLIMAKYGIGPEWFNNVPEAE